MIYQPIQPGNAELMWGSWLPAVLACFAQSTGHVLEVGIGHISTPALHALVLSSGRHLLSLEHDANWAAPFKARYAVAGRHEFSCGEYDVLVPMAASAADPLAANVSRWGVGFIDNSPGGERRRQDFITLIDVCDFVVVHDYHSENSAAIDPHLVGLNSKVCSTYGPPTLVASKFKPVPADLV